MNRVCLVGLGVITKHYKKGLEDSKCLDLVAVCDLNESALARSLYSDLHFYTFYKLMIDVEKPDLIIIATPPATHYEIAEYALKHKVGVILEKPATLNYEDCKKLHDLADEMGVFFTVMFHWQTGEEVLYFNQHFDLNKIAKIEVDINDSYSDDGVTIKNDRIPLWGAWVDSGVNALSLINKWVPFDDCLLIGVEVQHCTESGLPIFARADLQFTHHSKTIPVSISVDWRNDKSDKYTILKMVDGTEILIEHTAQKIVADGKEIVLDDMPRLERHYYNYFTNFENSSTDNDLMIHKILFEVDKLL